MQRWARGLFDAVAFLSSVWIAVLVVTDRADLIIRVVAAVLVIGFVSLRRLIDALESLQRAVSPRR